MRFRLWEQFCILCLRLYLILNLITIKTGNILIVRQNNNNFWIFYFYDKTYIRFYAACRILVSEGLHFIYVSNLWTFLKSGKLSDIVIKEVRTQDAFSYSSANEKYSLHLVPLTEFHFVLWSKWLLFYFLA